MLSADRVKLTVAHTDVEKAEAVIKLKQAGDNADYLEIVKAFNELPVDMPLSDVYFSCKLAIHVQHLAGLGRFDEVCLMLSSKGAEVPVLVKCLCSAQSS